MALRVFVTPAPSASVISPSLSRILACPKMAWVSSTSARAKAWLKTQAILGPWMCASMGWGSKETCVVHTYLLVITVTCILTGYRPLDFIFFNLTVFKNERRKVTKVKVLGFQENMWWPTWISFTSNMKSQELNLDNYFTRKVCERASVFTFILDSQDQNFKWLSQVEKTCFGSKEGCQ